MSYEAGTAFLQIVPSFAGVVDAITEEFSKDGDIAGQAFKDSAEEAMRGISASVSLDTAEADAKVDALAAKSPDIHAKVSVDGSDKAVTQLASVTGAAEETEGGLAGLAPAGGEAASALGPVAIAIGVLATTLVPLAGLATGALSTLPAVLGGLGVGLAAIALAAPGIEFLAKLTFDPLVKSLTPLVDNAILPGIAAGLNAIVPLFTALSPFVVEAAVGIGQFASQMGSLLGSGAGIFNLGVILQAGTGFMQQLGKAALQLVPAFLTIGAQATPILTGIGKGISDLVGDFAKWVANGGFETFVRWVQANGPGIVGDIENIAKAFPPIIAAVLPVGTEVLNLLGSFGKLIQIAAPFLVFVGNIVADVLEFTTPLVFLQGKIQDFGGAWASVWAFVVAAVRGAGEDLDTIWGGIVGGVESAGSFIGLAVGKVVGFFTDIPGDIKTGIGDVGELLYSVGSDLINGLKNGIYDAIHDLKSAIGSIPILGGLASAATGGFLAAGGPADAGVPYIVGEKGPELFVPNASGVVVPNSTLISGGISGGSSSPVQATAGSGDIMPNATLYIDNESDVQLLGQQLAFLRGARRL